MRFVSYLIFIKPEFSVQESTLPFANKQKLEFAWLPHLLAEPVYGAVELIYQKHMYLSYAGFKVGRQEKVLKCDWGSVRTALFYFPCLPLKASCHSRPVLQNRLSFKEVVGRPLD